MSAVPISGHRGSSYLRISSQPFTDLHRHPYTYLHTGGSSLPPRLCLLRVPCLARFRSTLHRLSHVATMSNPIDQDRVTPFGYRIQSRLKSSIGIMCHVRLRPCRVVRPIFTYDRCMTPSHARYPKRQRSGRDMVGHFVPRDVPSRLHVPTHIVFVKVQ